MKAFLFLAIAAILLVAGCAQQPGEKIAAQDGAQKQAEKPQQAGQEQPPALPGGENEQPPALPSDEINNATTAGSGIPPVPSGKPDSETASNSNPKEFIGLWRDFSSRMFYDAGGSGAFGTGSGVPLEINSDGTWKFGGSAGKWHADAIQDTDWKKWGIESYGPARKMVLEGWNKGVADGPVEEPDGRVDFFWVIYRVGPPTVGAPGQVQVKYGHAG